MRGNTGYAYLPAGQAEVEFAKYETRIKALEHQCKVLAEQCDRQGKVVDAAMAYFNGEISGLQLNAAIAVYRQQLAALAKEGG